MMFYIFFKSILCKLLIHIQAPSQVTGVSLSKVVRLERPSLLVTWTTPQSDLTISMYQVQYRRSGTTFWDSQVTIIGSLSTSLILTGLDVDTEYTVRVRAVSKIGAGEWSVEQTGITAESENVCISSTVIWHIHTCSR